jgi:uncharacterized protein YecT (DUF1311 family)
MRLHRILLACGAASFALCAGAASQSAAASPSAPVIHEKFTLLPCPSKPRTTLQLEGCAEHKVIATDRTIDSLNAKVFTKLRSAGQGAFVRANADWLAYRDAACTTEASIYSGGSIQPIAYANCLVSIDGSHVAELRQMLIALSPAG